ncbi:unnamed protein product [Brassica oleracea]
MFLSHKVCVFSGKATSFDGEVMMGSRGVISDKWSMRILWGCALGSAIGLYMVAVERQTQNRARALAEGMRAAESQGGGGDGDGRCSFLLANKVLNTWKLLNIQFVVIKKSSYSLSLMLCL